MRYVFARIQDSAVASEGGKVIRVGLQHFAPKSNVGELTMAFKVHKPGILELFQMVGYGRRRETRPLAYASASWGFFGFGDFLEHLEALPVSQRLADQLELLRIQLDCTRSHSR